MNRGVLFDKILLYLKALVNYPLAKVITAYSPLKNNKYFCISMSGNSYGDNIKCLSNYISYYDPEAEIVWAFSPSFFSKADCPYKSVKLYSYKYYFHILTSKYILSNARLNQRMLHKRKGQVYLQTWHGTALKRLGTDVKTRKRGWLQRVLSPNVFQFDVNNTDIMISGSKFMTNIFRNSFHFNGPIYETGTPRNDIFFEKHPEYKDRICKRYGIDNDSQIILYAPTFRSNGSFEYYDINSETVIKAWEKKTSRKCVFLVRLHPNLMCRSNEFSQLFPNAINVSAYPDMQELLYASDLLITDYSSSMFDFMYTYKPVLLYIPDKESYDRGFYFNIEDLPFIIISNNGQIINTISSFDLLAYKKSIDLFNIGIGSVENGTASEQIYQLLKNY
ncbi:MAG: CDP-glycerol glycerophosphotransferase family protein [Prevotella sp.]|nr:CDP-glycerol glycerophosphotransferase family protein [Prevotella sp.]